MCKPRVGSSLVVRGGSGVRRWGSVGIWTLVEREGVGMVLDVGEGAGMDEDREPMLIGVAGFLEVPTVIGVGTLDRTMFGMAR